MIRADSTRIWVTARGEVQHDSTGRIVGLRGTVQDITERKQRENALALFRSLIDGSNDALEVIDPPTLRFLDVNDKACRDSSATAGRNSCRLRSWTSMPRWTHPQ